MGSQDILKILYDALKIMYNVLRAPHDTPKFLQGSNCSTWSRCMEFYAQVILHCRSCVNGAYPGVRAD